MYPGGCNLNDPKFSLLVTALVNVKRELTCIHDDGGNQSTAYSATLSHDSGEVVRLGVFFYPSLVIGTGVFCLTLMDMEGK